MRPTRPDLAGPGWDRRRLLTGLAGVVLVVVVLLVGLVYAVRPIFISAAPASPVASGSATDRSDRGDRAWGREEMAAQPMLTVTPRDARPTTPAAIPAPTIVVPPPTRTGPADVPTGFPRTPEGAVGQLAAIETAVLQGMSITYTHDVYSRWALPDGVGVAGWEMTRDVQAFLGAARMGPALDLTATVVATPAAGLVKGADGPDWTVACVLLEVRATISTEARMGYGYCERMQWQHDRWMIGPGTPPAKAPSTWPGSDLSLRAGWRTWAVDEQGAG